MALENKLGLTSSADLAREEERLSKKKAVELFENGVLDTLPAGKFSTLQAIHKYLFEDIYDFAGKLRTVNLAKGNFHFAPLMYLEAALANIDKMPQFTFDEIIEKYVEMNIAHPFREGNGRSTRIWLDHILKTEIGKVVDWSKVNKYWTKAELNGLFQVETVNGKTILPIWHNLTKKQVVEYSPIIADRKAMTTASMTPEEIAAELKELFAPDDTEEQENG